MMNVKKLAALALGSMLLFSGCGRTSASSETRGGSETITVCATEATSSFVEEATDAPQTTTAFTTAVTTAPRTTPAVAADATTAAPQETAAAPEAPAPEAPEPYYPPEPPAQPRTEPYVPPVVTTAPAPKPPAVTTTKAARPADPSPQEVLAALTLREKVCQMFMVTPEALTGISPMTAVGNGTANALKNYPVGGIIYFAQNLTSRNQISSMIRNTQTYSKNACGVGLFTAIDEEGGSVARAAQKLGTAKFDNMAVYGASNNSATAYNIGSSIGRDLKSLGFNLDLAPVADVNINPANELGSRIFSSDPNVVANMSAGVVKGLQDSGVSATLKHFPGLGAEDGNTHTNSFVVIDRSLEQLRSNEFVAFKGGIDAGADFVMVGHQIVTGFGDDLPCDLSYVAVTQLLRGELGFDGIAITDSQMMNTISKVYSPGGAAVSSIKAGMDIILMPGDLPSAVNAVERAVKTGEISEERINESVLRILEKKYKLGLLR